MRNSPNGRNGGKRAQMNTFQRWGYRGCAAPLHRKRRTPIPRARELDKSVSWRRLSLTRLDIPERGNEVLGFFFHKLPFYRSLGIGLRWYSIAAVWCGKIERSPESSLYSDFLFFISEFCQKNTHTYTHTHEGRRWKNVSRNLTDWVSWLYHVGPHLTNESDCVVWRRREWKDRRN